MYIVRKYAIVCMSHKTGRKVRLWQINFTFTNNVCILCLSCNVIKAKNNCHI